VRCRIQAREPAPADSPPVIHDVAIVSSFLSDAAHVPGGFTPGVVFPATEADVAAAVSASGAVLPVGAQSSLTGGATPRGEVVISTRALTRIDPRDRHHVRVEAGVPLLDLQKRLAGSGRYYPPAPTYDGAFVGGTIATNAAGAATFKYGSTRAWIHAITVVLANGAVLDIPRGEVFASSDGVFTLVAPDGTPSDTVIPRYTMPQVPKLSAGYFAAPGMDLIDLFIGSEGTLGVITAAVLRVIDRPVTATALITCADDAQAIRVTTVLREQARLAWAGRGPLDVSAIEYMDGRSLRVVPDAAFSRSGVDRPRDESVFLLAQIELTQHEDAALGALADVLDAAGVATDPTLAAAGDERGAQRLFELREAVPASVNARVAQAKTQDDRIEKTAGDLIVPFESLAAALDEYRRVLDRHRLDYAIWGHLSDGNLHVNVIPRGMDDVMAGREALLEISKQVIARGGSPLAEHGVGRSPMKQRLLRELYGEEGIEQMRAVKRALDPAWKLSPGVLFPAQGQ